MIGMPNPDGSRCTLEVTMSADFQMTFRHSNDNLHVRVLGTFDGNSAHELINLLQAQYREGGRIFVDTAGLREVVPHGCAVFKNCLCRTQVPTTQLFFKGEKGADMAPPGSGWLIAPKHKKGCCGRCRCCSCRSNSDN